MNGCLNAPQRFKQVLYRMEQAAAWPDAMSDDGRIERFHHKGVVIEDLGHSDRNACLQSLPVGEGIIFADGIVDRYLDFAKSLPLSRNSQIDGSLAAHRRLEDIDVAGLLHLAQPGENPDDGSDEQDADHDGDKKQESSRADALLKQDE